MTISSISALETTPTSERPENVTHEKKLSLIYEKKLSLIYRLAIGILAAFAALYALFPCGSHVKQRAAIWWKQAVTGEEKGIPQVRSTPPVGRCDTVIFSRDGQLKSRHGTGSLFNDKEIVEKDAILRKEELEANTGIYAAYTKHGKAIIQQQGTRGCTAATAAMLIVDHGKKPNLTELLTRNLGSDKDQVRDIQNAGLTAMTNTASNLQELRTLILKNGSAIVSIGGELGGHVVVVDDVSEDLAKVRLRDPYHGWEITVTAAAFTHRCKRTSVIQVQP